VINGTFHLTEYEPAVSILMEVDNWVGPIKPAGGYRLSTAGEGTLVEMEERIAVRGPLKVLTPLLSFAFRRASRKVLRNLKLTLAQRNAHGE
jgi:hypothetical protein